VTINKTFPKVVKMITYHRPHKRFISRMKLDVRKYLPTQSLPNF